jgi:hypothetical protein
MTSIVPIYLLECLHSGTEGVLFTRPAACWIQQLGIDTYKLSLPPLSQKECHSNNFRTNY